MVTDPTQQTAGAGALPPELFRHWIHSREEDQGDVQFFRPPGFAFPPSFGRDGFTMRPDGEVVQDDVGPADGIVHVSGRWTQQGPGQVVFRFDGARPDYAFTVVGIILLALGIGVLIAAVMAYLLSSRLGLFPARPAPNTGSTHA